MATLEEFKKEESTLYKKIYRDTLKDSISSYLDSQNRKVAAELEKYMAELAMIYGEHIAKDTVFSGEMLSKNIAKRIERSLASIKTVNKTTGAIEPKFYSLMELCKYPLNVLEQNKDVDWFGLDNAVELAIAELQPLIDSYYENHETKNQQFNWDGYVNAYHKVLNKFVDQAVRGNDYSKLLSSLKTLDEIEKFVKSDDKYSVLRNIRTAYNDSTGFSNSTGTKESTGTYKFDSSKILESLYSSQMHLVQIYDKLPVGAEKLKVQNQIDYLERVIQVVGFSKGNSGTDLIKFFSKTDRPEMLEQFLDNMNSDWDIVANLSNNQCKKIMQNVDKYQSSKTYMAIKATLGQYVRENYERYVSEKALKDPNLLAAEMIKLSKICEQSTVSQILKLGKGVPDTELRNILEDVQNDVSVSLVEIIPEEIQKQIATQMSNKNFLDNRVLFNTWKYSTEQYISVNDLIEARNGVSENFESEHNIPKSVAMKILWENVLALNRMDYYFNNDKISNKISSMIEELENDGIYADWSDSSVASSIWEGRTFEQELARVENLYGQILPLLTEEVTDSVKK